MKTNKKLIVVICALCFSITAWAQSIPDHTLTARAGLPNFFARLQKNQPVTIAYFGGSITGAGNGYRIQTEKWFKETCPDVSFTMINAAIGGTGSDLGAVRVDDDVLAHHPNLVFVEFAVNDGGSDSLVIINSMEGIVRKIWKQDISTDICFLYTTDEQKIVVNLQGRHWKSVCAMERVANHYGIPSISMDFAVAKLAKENKLIIKGDKDKDYGGKIVFTNDAVHPTTEGHEVYTQTIVQAFQKMPRKIYSRKMPTPLSAGNYERSGMYSTNSAGLWGNWVQLGHGNEIYDRFKNLFPELFRGSTSNEQIIVKFKGRRLGFCDVIGPGTGRLTVNIDDQPPFTIQRFDKHCQSYRFSYFWLPEVEDGEHVVTLKTDTFLFDKESILTEAPTNRIRPELENRDIYLGKIMVIGELLPMVQGNTSSLSISADIPNVLVLGDDIEEEFGICLKNDIYNALNFNNRTHSPIFCEWKNITSGSSGLLSFLEKFNNPANARVLLLNCGIKDAGNHTDKSLQHYKVTLTKIVKKAKELNMEILWYDTPVMSDNFPYNYIPEYNRIAKDIMTEHKIYTIDFALFWKGLCNSTQFNRDSIKMHSRKKSEFLAESLAQWWTGAAHGNQSIKRIPLWKELPPYFEFTNSEHINSSARITHVSTPELEYFLPQKRQNAPAVIFFPGGGYRQLGFLRNARELAELLNPYGISVIGLKYRTGRPLEVSLSDAQRAVRYVRAHAEEWGIDPNRIGIAGQSAGANLALNLCCNYSAGNSYTNDKIEQMSSRPNFVVLLTIWNFLSNEYPFTFKVDLPPFFVRHAKNDTGFLLAEQIVSRLHEYNIPVDALFIDKGGHGAFEIKDTNAGYKWPDDFVLWLRKQLIL